MNASPPSDVDIESIRKILVSIFEKQDDYYGKAKTGATSESSLILFLSRHPLFQAMAYRCVFMLRRGIRVVLEMTPVDSVSRRASLEALAMQAKLQHLGVFHPSFVVPELGQKEVHSTRFIQIAPEDNVIERLEVNGIDVSQRGFEFARKYLTYLYFMIKYFSL